MSAKSTHAALVDAIERRTTYLIRQYLLAIEVLFSAPNVDTFRTSKTLQREIETTARDIERFALQWAALVPEHDVVRAAVARELFQRYDFHADDIAQIREVLHLDSPTVLTEYEALTGQPLHAALMTGPRTQALGNATQELSFLAVGVQRDIEAVMTWRYLQRGEMLFDEDDAGDSLYIIVSGNLRVEKRQPDGSYQLLVERGVGRIIGEMAVITDDLRSARVVAARDSELIRFAQADFNALTVQHPQIMLSMAQVIINRFRETLAARPVTRQLKTVAFIALGHDIHQYVQLVGAALRAYGTTLHLTIDNLDDKFFDGAARALKDPFEIRSIATMLNEAEEQYDFILFEATGDNPDWTERALLQADHVFLVAQGGTDPAPQPIEDLLNTTAARTIPTELVLVYPDGTRHGHNTAAWLDARPQLADHYNVHLNADGAARLARRIAGRMVGLVFGGGALRVYAQGGVLRVLQEDGVPLDYVGGTSAGGIIAALAAEGLNTAEMRAAVEQGLTDFLDYTLPFVALTAGKRITENLQAIFQERKIEDMFTKFYCVATNASTAEEVIFTRGLIWRALRASASLPGVFPPIIADNEQGDLLVDGAVLNNLPVDVMRRLCNGTVIAVDISTPKATARRYNHGDYVSGINILLNRLNPLRKKRIKGPSMAPFLSRLSYISSMQVRAQSRNAADLIITPDVAEFSIFDSSAFDAMFARGVAAGTAALQQWHSEHPGWKW